MPARSESLPTSPGLAVGPHDMKLMFPVGRSAKLPDIYEAFEHPLHRGSGKAYFFIHEGTLEAALETYKLEVNELKIPQGPRGDAISLGKSTLV